MRCRWNERGSWAFRSVECKRFEGTSLEMRSYDFFFFFLFFHSRQWRRLYNGRYLATNDSDFASDQGLRLFFSHPRQKPRSPAALLATMRVHVSSYFSRSFVYSKRERRKEIHRVTKVTRIWFACNCPVSASYREKFCGFCTDRSKSTIRKVSIFLRLYVPM